MTDLPDRIARAEASAIIDRGLIQLSMTAIDGRTDPTGMLVAFPLALMGRRCAPVFETERWMLTTFCSVHAVLGLFAGVAVEIGPGLDRAVRRAMADDISEWGRTVWAEAHTAYSKLPRAEAEGVQRAMEKIETALEKVETAARRLRDDG